MRLRSTARKSAAFFTTSHLRLPDAARLLPAGDPGLADQENPFARDPVASWLVVGEACGLRDDPWLPRVAVSPDWLSAFVITLALELPIYAGLLRKVMGARRALLVGFAVNALTHPVLWFLWPWFGPWWLWLTTGELLVFAVETFLVAASLRFQPEPRRAMMTAGMASMCANAVSAAAGLFF